MTIMRSVAGCRRITLALTFLAALAAVAAASATGTAPMRSSAHASLYGVKIAVPGQSPVVAGAHGGTSTIKSWDGTFLYPDDGSVVSVGTLTGQALPSARGTAVLTGSDVARLSLFGGEITADA